MSGPTPLPVRLPPQGFENILGWKAVAYRDGGWRSPAFSESVWIPGEWQQASCDACCCPPPNPQCECGFHFWPASWPLVNSGSMGFWPNALVEVGGRVLFHEAGARAERMRIIRFCETSGALKTVAKEFDIMPPFRPWDIHIRGIGLNRGVVHSKVEGQSMCAEEANSPDPVSHFSWEIYDGSMGEVACALCGELGACVTIRRGRRIEEFLCREHAMGSILLLEYGRPWLVEEVK